MTLRPFPSHETHSQNKPHDKQGDDSAVAPGSTLTAPLQRLGIHGEGGKKKCTSREVQLAENLPPRGGSRSNVVRNVEE